jgi:hypothetical protein
MFHAALLVILIPGTDTNSEQRTVVQSGHGTDMAGSAADKAKEQNRVEMA